MRRRETKALRVSEAEGRGDADGRGDDVVDMLIEAETELRIVCDSREAEADGVESLLRESDAEPIRGDAVACALPLPQLPSLLSVATELLEPQLLAAPLQLMQAEAETLLVPSPAEADAAASVPEMEALETAEELAQPEVLPELPRGVAVRKREKEAGAESVLRLDIFALPLLLPRGEFVAAAGVKLGIPVPVTLRLSDPIAVAEDAPSGDKIAA